MAERAYGWAARLNNIVDAAGIPSETHYFIHESAQRSIATICLLQAHLAIQLYQSDRGQLPSRLDDLVPQYLAAVPIDAYSGRPLIYRPTPDGFVLYSVGHDHSDNGGKFTNMQTYYTRTPFGSLNPTAGYDYDLETNTRP